MVSRAIGRESVHVTQSWPWEYAEKLDAFVPRLIEPKGRTIASFLDLSNYKLNPLGGSVPARPEYSVTISQVLTAIAAEFRGGRFYDSPPTSHDMKKIVHDNCIGTEGFEDLFVKQIMSALNITVGALKLMVDLNRGELTSSDSARITNHPNLMSWYLTVFKNTGRRIGELDLSLIEYDGRMYVSPNPSMAAELVLAIPYGRVNRQEHA